VSSQRNVNSWFAMQMQEAAMQMQSISSERLMIVTEETRN